MYRIVFVLLYLVSLLPFRLLYIISDIAYLLLYYVIRYRRDVVLSNLKIAFPEKSEQELNAISRQSYKNLTDNFIETIKLLSISKKTLNRRFEVDCTLLNEMYASGRKVHISLGHFFNWEIANLAVGINSPYTQLVVYMPIENKIFDRLFSHLRSRFGSKLVAATRFRKDIAPYWHTQHCLVLVADQSPGHLENSYWLPFFGRMSAFVTGPEKGAKMMNAAVVFTVISKKKRGYYKAEFHPLTLDAKSMADGEITRKLVAFIEDSIHAQPANYLWSHRRWKRTFDPALHTAI